MRRHAAPAHSGRVTLPPLDPPPDDADELEALGYVPPDENEPPPVELWSAVGDVQPWATLVLLLSWGAVFLAMALRREVGDSASLFAWGASATGLPWRETAWRLLASTFLHSGAAHVFFNATSLAILGPAVERCLTRSGYWLVVALGGVAASLASLLVRAAKSPVTSYSVGGSGVVFALGGALLVVAFRLRHRLAPSRARALAAALLYLLVPAFVAGLERVGTDNVAHAGGLAAGVALGAVLPLSERLGGPRGGVVTRALGALAALALAAALLLAVRGGLALV